MGLAVKRKSARLHIKQLSGSSRYILTTPIHRDLCSCSAIPQEESGLDANPIHCGTFFYGEEGYEHIFQIEIFRVDDYNGEPVE